MSDPHSTHHWFSRCWISVSSWQSQMSSLKRRRSLATCGGSWWLGPWLGQCLGPAPPPWTDSKSSGRSVRDGYDLISYISLIHESLVMCEGFLFSFGLWQRAFEINLPWNVTVLHKVRLSDSGRFTAPVILKGTCRAVFGTWSMKEDYSHYGGAMGSMFLKLPQKRQSSSQLMNR